MNEFSCFKAYDIRGKLGEELNEEIAYRIGRAFTDFLDAKKIAIGGDIRPTSESLKQAVAKGIMDAGADVIDIGLTGTEEAYFAAFHLDVDGAIEITASHNPIDYNGMKFVGRGAVPISGDHALPLIKAIAQTQNFKEKQVKGNYQKIDISEAYIDHLLTFINLENFTPLTLVVNAGNGVAGPIVDKIEARFKAHSVPVTFIKLHHTPDENFPNGIPNPILKENRGVTSRAVIEHKADMGIAWDGDFDRCFLFDSQGNFIEGYYIVGLLAEAFLRKYPNEKVIYDPRLIWNTIDIAHENNGIAIQSKTGHAFIKEKMREENAIYGGEMSAHHYFRDFAYCDSGMIPWLLIAEMVCVTQKSLDLLVDKRIKKFPCSGEVNFKVSNTQKVIEAIHAHFAADEDLQYQENIDGLSMVFSQWRFNVRASNTEPLLRLNVEAKSDMALVQEKFNEICTIIEQEN